MGFKTWAIAGGLTLALFGAAVGLPAGAASAQSSRPQVPLFEPDPLWFEALPNRWVTGAIGGVVGRFARQRLGVPSPGIDRRQRKGRVVQPAARRVLYSCAIGLGVRAHGQVPASLGRARPGI